MVDRFKAMVLRMMKVPPEPEPPAGSDGSVTIFRASKRFFQLNLVRWGFAQISTLIGIIVALTFLRVGAFGLEAVLARIPYEDLATTLVTAAEVLGIALFIIQLPISFFLVVLDWEMRWYIVTDRSLRIREGVVRVKEMTMTFANVQEVSIQQGPLQRLLGISDLRVRTAGGGAVSGPPAKQRQQEAHSLHIGYFHGVDNAGEIRDLILKRLKQLRDAGLGDPDQVQTELVGSEVETMAGTLLTAARGLLTETRALRQSAGG
ncbi:MAG: PH domain-containing protein [Acidobacteria bacterium]|nr:MAG: PH domain-containing protein [Acidobacteriota bacterium]